MQQILKRYREILNYAQRGATIQQIAHSLQLPKNSVAAVLRLPQAKNTLRRHATAKQKAVMVERMPLAAYVEKTHRLTKREAEMLNLHNSGMKPREIAERLDVTPRTVYQTLHNGRNKILVLRMTGGPSTGS